MSSHSTQRATSEGSEVHKDETVRTLRETLRLAAQNVTTTRNELQKLEHQIARSARLTPEECAALHVEIDRRSNAVIAALLRLDELEEAVRVALIEYGNR